MSKPQSPEIRERDNQENLQQMVSTLQALEIGITAYHEGKSAGWMIVSAYLHQLLTDTAGGDPLLKRLFVEFGFHPLHHDLSGSENRYLLRADTIIHPGSKFSDIFDLDARIIPLDAWLKQVIYTQAYHDQGYPITIRELIIRPRHQGGGVHFDPKVRLDFHLVEGMFSFFSGEERVTFRDCLVIIGEYIHARITYELMGALGNGYREQGLIEKAEEFLNTSLQNARKAEDLHSQCIQLQNLGYLYSQQRKQFLAAQHYEEAKQVNEILGDFETEQSILRNLTVTWIEIGNQDFDTGGENKISAINAYEKAVEYAQTVQDYQSFIVALANLGDLQFKQSNSQNAALAATKSFLAFWQLDEKDKQAIEMRRAFTRASRILFMLYQQEQNFEKVLYETLKLIATDDSNTQNPTNEEQIENTKKEILDYLVQLLREFPK